MSSRETDGSQLEFGDDEKVVALRRAWDRTLRALAQNVSKSSESFLRSSEPLSFDGAIAVLSVQSRFAREWLEKRHYEALRTQLATHLSCPTLELRFVLASTTAPRAPLEPRTSAPADGDALGVVTGAMVSVGKSPGGDSLPETTPIAPASRAKALPAEMCLPLNSKYTFDNLVVGKSNRLAHAGACAVAQNPGTLYNPLYIYGPPGLGKTHIMHAIGHRIRQEQPDARIAYVSGEAFTNGYISALRESRSDRFRAMYRSVDVWLVDDVQTIAGKEHTKEEFFHTFNTLHQMNKQVILSSDKAPRDLRLMDERLRSRFESGLIADIAPPDLEMRVAILQRKAEVDGLVISDEVLMYMASLIQSNIRSLEGALIRLIAYASMSHSPVTTDLARDVLGSYFVERRRVTADEHEGALMVAEGERSPLKALPLPEVARRLALAHQTDEEKFHQIVDAVAAHFGVDPRFLAGDGSAASGRRREIATPRQIAIYLTRERTRLPVTEIAHLFGDVNHSAISHAHKKMIGQLQTNPQVLGAVQVIQGKLEE